MSNNAVQEMWIGPLLEAEVPAAFELETSTFPADEASSEKVGSTRSWGLSTTACLRRVIPLFDLFVVGLGLE